MSGPTRVCLNRVSMLGENLDFPIGETEPNPGHKNSKKIELGGTERVLRDA